MKNETAIIGSSSGGKIVYSHAVTLYEIPIVYIVIAVLFALFIFVLSDEEKR